MFEVYASTPENLGPESIAAHAQRAEAMGCDGLHVPDALHDGLLLAALALNATRTLRVGTGVLVAFPRSPMTVAVAAWDLQRLSGGRFELGIGTQVKANIEERYSARWDSPVPQLREYMQSLRAIFHSFQTGAPLRFEGAHYQFTRLQPFFNPGPIDHPAIPIFCGAVGPDMTRMAGRIADGLIAHPTQSPPECIRELCLPALRAGFERGGKDGKDGPGGKDGKGAKDGEGGKGGKNRKDRESGEGGGDGEDGKDGKDRESRKGGGKSRAAFHLLLSPLLATGPDDAAVAAEWEKQRNLLGFLFSTPAYWRSLELFGWRDLGPRLRELSRAGDWRALGEALSDDMLEKFVPRGAYGDIAAVLRARYGELIQRGGKTRYRIAFPLPANPALDKQAGKAIAQLKGC